MVQEKLRREDSVETEKWNLLFGLLLWELIPLMWYDLGIREEVKIYQRLLKYIDLPTKTDNDSNLIIKEGVPKFWHTLFHND